VWRAARLAAAAGTLLVAGVTLTLEGAERLQGCWAWAVAVPAQEPGLGWKLLAQGLGLVVAAMVAGLWPALEVGDRPMLYCRCCLAPDCSVQ
jgi:hypothetical protein